MHIYIYIYDITTYVVLYDKLHNNFWIHPKTHAVRSWCEWRGQPPGPLPADSSVLIRVREPDNATRWLQLERVLRRRGGLLASPKERKKRPASRPWASRLLVIIVAVHIIVVIIIIVITIIKTFITLLSLLLLLLSLLLSLSLLGTGAPGSVLRDPGSRPARPWAIIIIMIIITATIINTMINIHINIIISITTVITVIISVGRRVGPRPPRPRGPEALPPISYNMI